ncbi:MAG TPA: Hsp20/alpha crystallin family protein [Anaerolineaceae bacterium]|jgi:HSP20 family protein
MTLYITPYPHRVRRAVNHFNPPEDAPEMQQGEVLFPIDVVAETDGFVLSALLPGVKADDLDIQIVNETVSIRGALPDHRDEKTSYLLQERPSGRFSRVLTLPAELDSTHAEANLEDGVLTLRILKAETARPKAIKVTTRA